MKNLKKYTLIYLSLVILCWLFFYIILVQVSSDLIWSFPPSLKLANIGVFGDSFNILTSLFTGLAFAGMAISIMYQRESIKEQLKDREQSRKEFIKQNEILKSQQQEFQNQSFDNKFFQLIQLLNNIVERWSMEHFNVTTDEYENLENDKVFTELKFLLETRLIGCRDIEIYYEKFNKHNTENDTTMKYFFINLFQILKFIDNKKDTDDTKQHYADILCAQLSKNVLILLFYNVLGLNNSIGKEYLNLTKKYKFLEEINKNDLGIEDELSQILFDKLKKGQSHLKKEE